jgi:RNA ligase (TIGR02306 family)
MSFEVTVRRIAEVIPHPNADRLDIVHLENYDYDSIVQKSRFAVGDVVVYFPVDSQLPLAFVQALGLDGKLAHGMPSDEGVRLQNRVKTANLRGIVSQGIVARPQDLPLSSDIQTALETTALGSSVTDMLGVLKYEPPVILSTEGTLVRLPENVSKYDLENAQSHASVVAQLMAANTHVMVTEKIEGSHWFVTRTRDGEFGVGQRNYLIEPVEGVEHTWHRAAREGNYAAITEALMAQFPRVNRVTIRGEIVGPDIAINYYNLSAPRVYVFEIEFDGEPISALFFKTLATTMSMPLVPILAFDLPLSEILEQAGHTTVKALSNGVSALAPKRLREGVVIRPMEETQSADLEGRLILKQRSPDYLAKTEN